MLYDICAGDSRRMKEVVAQLKGEPAVAVDRSAIYVDSDKSWDEMRKLLPDCIVGVVQAKHLLAQYSRKPQVTKCAQ